MIKPKPGKVGENLGRIRAKLGMNLTQFSKPIGYSSAYIGQVERGEKAPSNAFQKAVCNTFFVNPSFLENGQGEIFVSPNDQLKRVIGERYDVLESMGFVFKEPSGTYPGNNDILAKLNRLSPKDRELIEGLIDRCLELHGQVEAPPAKRKKAAGE